MGASIRECVDCSSFPLMFVGCTDLYRLDAIKQLSSCRKESDAVSFLVERGWLGPGGLPGLQNRWRAAQRAAVGSTPIHSRLPI
jgi:hypothetical protein